MTSEEVILALRRRTRCCRVWRGAWTDDAPLLTHEEETELLERERAERLERARERQEERRRTRPREGDRETAYVQGALDSAVARVLASVDGGRRNTLNREAFGVGGLVGGGLLDLELATEALVQAGLAVGLPEREARATAAAALAQGVRRPRTVPDSALPRQPAGGRIPRFPPGGGTSAG